jgi:UDP-2,3-diacylglucosamine pyrophosphatase LpxH
MQAPSQQKNGYVVSDLHIFGCSSLYERNLPSFYQSVLQHSIIVLNGDTFDYKRSIYQTASETTAHALSWLSDLLERSPHATFHYVVGNHDCQSGLLDGISRLADSTGAIQLHQSHVRLGSNLFLHGDVLDLVDPNQSIEERRLRYSTVEPSRLSKIFAHTVTHLRLNAVEYVRHSSQSVSQRILRHIQSSYPNDLHGVRAIYFGHTHVPMSDCKLDGIEFYNTGSFIRGLRWSPLEFAA